MIIAIEGIDGAGKGTLTRTLQEYVREQGYQAATLSFPRYQETKFSKLVADYLNGGFGGIDEVPVQFAALLYAGDRYESRETLQSLVAANDFLILDRYVFSNAAYNGAKVFGDDRKNLIDWIYQTEFGLFDLPAPDLVCLLATDVILSNDLIAKKAARSYTSDSHDMHEGARDYMSVVAEVYEELALRGGGAPWYRLDPSDGAAGLRKPQDLCAELWQAIAPMLDSR